MRCARKTKTPDVRPSFRETRLIYPHSCRNKEKGKLAKNGTRSNKDILIVMAHVGKYTSSHGVPEMRKDAHV